MNKSEQQVRWGVRIHVLSYVTVNLIQILVWWLFTPEQHFWPVWSIVAWGAGLVAHIWAARSAAQKFART